VKSSWAKKLIEPPAKTYTSLFSVKSVANRLKNGLPPFWSSPFFRQYLLKSKYFYRFRPIATPIFQKNYAGSFPRVAQAAYLAKTFRWGNGIKHVALQALLHSVLKRHPLYL
jgi:hypothetical protein